MADEMGELQRQAIAAENAGDFEWLREIKQKIAELAARMQGPDPMKEAEKGVNLTTKAQIEDRGGLGLPYAAGESGSYGTPGELQKAFGGERLMFRPDTLRKMWDEQKGRNR
jgi:predicted metalloendopeptidase